MPDIVALTMQFREALLRRERRAARALVQAYGEAYRAIRTDLNKLLVQITEARESGQTVSQSWLYQQNRLESLLTQVEREITKFSSSAENIITDARRVALTSGLNDAYLLIEGSFPASFTSFSKLPSIAFESLLGALQVGSPLAELLSVLPVDAVNVVRASLLNGVASGQGVRQIARSMREALGGQLSDSLRLARTEVMRAYRSASLSTYRSNSQVLRGWIWLCAFSRSCIACMVNHGKEYPLTETLQDHPNGKCVPMPVTRSYAELGIDVEELPRVIESGESRFNRLPESEQRRALGKSGYEAWSRGRAKLSDFVVTRTSPQWGTSIGRKPLSQVVGATQ